MSKNELQRSGEHQRCGFANEVLHRYNLLQQVLQG